MVIDWERLLTAGRIVLYGGFAIVLLVAGVIWFIDKCQYDDNYKHGCGIFLGIVIMTALTYLILGVI